MAVPKSDMLRKHMSAMRKITAHKRSLLHVMTGCISSQLCHRFLQSTYIGNLIYGVASAAVEEFVRKVKGRVPCTGSAALQRRLFLSAVRSEFVYLMG